MVSILMEEVKDFVFVLASHQIWIHLAKRSDFYLRMRCRPIIEDSDGVRFANYCLKYEGIEEDLAVAGLDEETGNWANVDDFKWLRAVQSPNWSILPAEERVGDVDLANSSREWPEANLVNSVQVTRPIMVAWKPPFVGCVKLNVGGGGCNVDSGAIYAIRDHLLNRVRGFTMNRGVGKVLVAELWSFLKFSPWPGMRVSVILLWNQIP
ncbi:hypothetical protein Ddye_013692 [Dipteronia dyeriana]|uniref:C-CAP/cofactor C-like domain-containing protein n=1 Tax=Dipteronia dyeriana TaxID=168575 RepID=A0AAD9X6J7_9ROSI|nr:hypothetical protein Ddye_013692 [Dipteronia dyeriana]